MGCQGEIANIYGVEVDAHIFACPNGKERNPIIYALNGVNNVFLCDETDEEDLDLSQYPEIHEIRNHGYYTTSYGPSDLTDPKLEVIILGHDGKYELDMGARHFEGKALLGFHVCSESYLHRAQPLPNLDKIKGLSAELYRKIFEEFGLVTNPNQYKLWLHFDSINGI